MIAAILRIVLLLAPLVAVIMWLRWRVREDRTEEELQADFAKMRMWLVAMLGITLLAALGLRFMDDGTGDARTKYIPPHTEDGVVVPGRFVPADEDTGNGGKQEKQDSDQN
ncbi:MAG: hypothetical protein HWE25_10485 [Alphaproteobacteria bacterium]|nr:hypothetical protein [Alphaproteobacteria bacterium]